MRSLLASVWSFVERQVLAGVLTAIRGEKNFRREQSNLEEGKRTNGVAAKEIRAEAVTSHTEREVARGKSLEEKARSNLTVASVCSTLVFAGLTFLMRPGIAAWMHFRLILLICFFLSILYFVGSVICALRALQITKTWIVDLNDELQSSDKVKELRLGCLELNRLETNIKANWTAVSLSCLRNAVISLLVFAGIVVFLIMYPGKLAAATTLPEATASAVSQTVTPSALKSQCEASSRCDLLLRLFPPKQPRFSRQPAEKLLRLEKKKLP